MTEDERILGEVEKCRIRAKDLGLLNLLILFRDHLEFLEEGPNPERLPKSVTDVKVANIRSGSDSIQVREVFFGEKSFLFAFKPKTELDPGGELYLTSHLLLMRDGQTLFDLFCLGKMEEWLGTVWRPFRVEAFLEGPWVEEITMFSQEVFNLADQRKRNSQLESKKRELEVMKEKFGLR